MLLRSGADPNIKTTSQGATPLHVAAQRNHIEVVKALLDSPSVDVNTQDSTRNQYTALHVASLRGHTDVVKSLLDANANPNIVNALGQSPLSLATQRGHTHIANLLLCNGAQPEISSEVTSTDEAVPKPYADQSMLETEPKKPVDPDSSNEVPVTNEQQFESYIDQGRLETDENKPVDLYETLDYESSQRRGNLKQFLLYSLSHPMHTFREKKSRYIYDLIDADKKHSEQSSYQSVESSNKDSTPVQPSTKLHSRFPAKERVKPKKGLVKVKKLFSGNK